MQRNNAKNNISSKILIIPLLGENIWQDLEIILENMLKNLNCNFTIYSTPINNLAAQKVQQIWEVESPDIVITYMSYIFREDYFIVMEKLHALLNEHANQTPHSKFICLFSDSDRNDHPRADIKYLIDIYRKIPFSEEDIKNILSIDLN